MPTNDQTSAFPASMPSASRSPLRQVRPRTVVAILWLFAILNYLYCDVLALHRAEYLRDLLTGSVNGVEFNRPMLLAAGALMSVPKRKVPVVSFAGRNAAVGPGVTGFKASQQVYGAARGAYAEFVLAREDQIAAKPPRLTFEEAAVLAYPAFPALQGLRGQGHVQPGQQVLVIGASGAVGSIAVQLAKAFDSEVTGVCGPCDLGLTKSLGASENFTDGTRRYDLILDVFGRTPLRRLRLALTRTGTLVIVGGEGGRWIGGLQRQIGAALLSPFVPQTLKFFVAKETSTALQEINQLVDAGKLTPMMARLTTWTKPLMPSTSSKQTQHPGAWQTPINPWMDGEGAAVPC